LSSSSQDAAILATLSDLVRVAMSMRVVLELNTRAKALHKYKKLIKR
jgi:hypothetical protein